MPVLKIENHSSAWSRVYDFKRGSKKTWTIDSNTAMRMRGYTELTMGDLDAGLRKKVDTALRRGYTLERNSRLVPVLRLLEKVWPADIPPIGYVGKTELTLFAMDEDEANELQRALNANTVMTEVFKGSKIRVSKGRNGWWVVIVSLWIPRAHRGSTKHMAPRFTELRVSIDEWMKAGASEREKVARWCAEDDRVIRVPFDSHIKRGVE